MTFLKNATVALAAMSVAFAPVAASAATPRFDDLRANTQLENEAALTDGGLSAEALVLLLASIAAIIAGIVIAADGTDDSPTSPN
jgi:hypothetical protein